MRRREFVFLSGATVALSGIARAQPAGKVPIVGYLWHAASAKEEHPYFEAVVDGFARLGYVEGRSIRLEHRFPNEIPARFKSMAAELVASNVDVLMGGAVAAPYLRDATTRIPIVFMFVPDPVGMELVPNLARPGGNITGLSNFGRETAGKRLQLLKEVVPNLSRVALLINPDQQGTGPYVDAFRSAADQLRLVLQAFEARSSQEFEPAFDAMVGAGMQAMTPAQGGLFFQGRAILPKLALARRMPMCAYSRETFEYGALVSYGPDQLEICRRSAVYVDKILKGAKPGDLPVEQPTKFELFVNLKTANTLGLTIPQSVLLRADDVVQ
jgi:putative ABC transport system substrate-binding protein